MGDYDARARGGRPLAVLSAAVFAVSSIFPVTAGLAKTTDSFPKWWGKLDVGIAFFLAALALVILARAGTKPSIEVKGTTYRAYRMLIHGVWMLLVVFFLFGDRIHWTYCLTGLAWRAWLLLYSLPAWFTLLGIGAEATSRL